MQSRRLLSATAFTQRELDPAQPSERNKWHFFHASTIVIDVPGMVAEKIIVVRVKEFLVIEVPVFIEVRPLDRVLGRAQGASLLHALQPGAKPGTSACPPGQHHDEKPAGFEEKEQPPGRLGGTAAGSGAVPSAASKGSDDNAERGSTATTEWKVVGRKGLTPWQLAEQQRQLPANTWEAQKIEQQKAEAVRKLQNWWRARLHVWACGENGHQSPAVDMIEAGSGCSYAKLSQKARKKRWRAKPYRNHGVVYSLSEPQRAEVQHTNEVNMPVQHNGFKDLFSDDDVQDEQWLQSDDHTSASVSTESMVDWRQRKQEGVASGLQLRQRPAVPRDVGEDLGTTVHSCRSTTEVQQSVRALPGTVMEQHAWQTELDEERRKSDLAMLEDEWNYLNAQLATELEFEAVLDKAIVAKLRWDLQQLEPKILALRR